MGNRFQILCDTEGLRLDVFLAQKLTITRTRVKNLLDQGHVLVHGKPAKASAKTRKGMVVEGRIPDEEPLDLEPEAIPLEILFDDPYLMAINKPPGMVVHPSFGHAKGTLVNAVLGYLEGEVQGARCKVQGMDSQPSPCPSGPSPLRSNLAPRSSILEPSFSDSSLITHHSSMPHTSDTPTRRHADTPDPDPRLSHSSFIIHQSSMPHTTRPGIVHRLDKGTTGVILVARDPKTQEMLSALFKKRDIEKVYRTIVEGVVRKDTFIVEGRVGRHPVERKKMAVLAEGGREALTSFKVLERLKGFTYLEAYPKTGRTHQIRVHLSHAGHSVVGDELYGRTAKHLTGRPLLHAYRIRFTHPVTGQHLSIEAPVPEDMEQFITTAGTQ